MYKKCQDETKSTPSLLLRLHLHRTGLFFCFTKMVIHLGYECCLTKVIHIFFTGYVYSGFYVVFFDRFLIILGGEGGCLDRFFNRLLTRDPASEVCSVLR